MKIRRKKINSGKMWIEQVTIKVNDGPELEVELEIENARIFVHYPPPCCLNQIDNFMEVKDCVRLDEDETVDLVHLLHKGQNMVQFRFASRATKDLFLDCALRERQIDSGNSNTSTTPSPPPEN